MKTVRSNRYQIVLIVLFLVVSGFLSYFLFRELFPEYKEWQKRFIALEEFRSSYSGQIPAPFQTGVKQLVLKQEKGPEEVDRCISCHVALDISDYSKTEVAKDVLGQILVDEKGVPLQRDNPNYIFAKLRQKREDLEQHGQLNEAKALESLTTLELDGRKFSVDRVLVAHPLLGKETRPFELHPINEYGCVSCHGGNGRALTFEKAHGPVFDGEYEIAHEGKKPQFLPVDPKNDPLFSKVFNHKPGHSLLFQTSPLLVGPLLEAKCVQCHTPSQQKAANAKEKLQELWQQRQKELEVLQQSVQEELKAFIVLSKLKASIESLGLEATREKESAKGSVEWTEKEKQEHLALLQFLAQEDPLEQIEQRQLEMLGSASLVLQAEKEGRGINELYTFLESAQNDPRATGTLFLKMEKASLDAAVLQHVKEVEGSYQKASLDQAMVGVLETDVDRMTKHFQRGQSLYFSQGCYACHKIEGLTRGGVGPELSKTGLGYPWFIKESIVWPQADLASSTMPNYVLDHEELQDLMTFLLAQRGKPTKQTEVERKAALRRWEQGEATLIEKPVDKTLVQNVEAGLMTFAREGCASCHRLKGYTSEVGFTVEKEKIDFLQLYQEKEWFQRLVPEGIDGPTLVSVLETNAEALSKRLSVVRDPGTLEQLNELDPALLMSFYAPFKFAYRAKNHTQNEEEIASWKELVHNVLLIFAQEYGVGRLIGPKPNWSGVYRSDEWLMEHFKNPSGHVARSIMPVMPFDTSKFWQLTYMLDQVGKKNRDAVRQIWQTFGFQPEKAYELHCAQCHGETLQGNGPVATWIYPIPKNLRSGTYLRNLTKEKATESILYGIPGGPMPPWHATWPEKGPGFATPVLTEKETEALVNWIYEQLPAKEVFEEGAVPKWEYRPEDILQELLEEGAPVEKEKEPLRGAFFPLLSSLSVSDFFQVVHPSPSDVEKKEYYIKRSYYTKENLAEGKRLFELHCAMCHGQEADGGGDRAEAMQDAKPRMLTNLDWIRSKDDLRLLRSIKYGVPWTSMTAFGDVTTAWQRALLVMYIRSLSEEGVHRKTLAETLYHIFSTADRALLSQEQEVTQKLVVLQGEQKELPPLREVEEWVNAPKLLEEKEQLEKALSKEKEQLHLLSELQRSLDKEKRRLQSLGSTLLSQTSLLPLFQQFLQFLQQQEQRLYVANKKLLLAMPSEKEAKAVRDAMVRFAQTEKMRLAKEVERRQVRLATQAQKQKNEETQEQIALFERIEEEILFTFAEVFSLWEQQKTLYQKLTHYD